MTSIKMDDGIRYEFDENTPIEYVGRFMEIHKDGTKFMLNMDHIVSIIEKQEGGG